LYHRADVIHPIAISPTHPTHPTSPNPPHPPTRLDTPRYAQIHAQIRLDTPDLHPANQLQITANHMICKLSFSMLFGTLICTDLHLICNLQITANHAWLTFKKHGKTRANQRKSLQITSLGKHRKNNADLHRGGAC
jgi:hypothetical protein